jgi:hypothetical protein
MLSFSLPLDLIKGGNLGYHDCLFSFVKSRILEKKYPLYLETQILNIKENLFPNS